MIRPPEQPPEIREWVMSDGARLRGRTWPAAKPGRTPILYFHGIQSHGGWYEWSAARLARVSGAAVVMVDRRGSGMNRDARGDVPDGGRWLADVSELADALSVDAAGAVNAARVRLAGVSWGGKLAAAWALANPGRVEALLLLAPGIFPRVDVSFARKIEIGVSLVSNPTRAFEIPLSDPALFTSNAAAQSAIAADPLKLTHATARFLYHSARMDRMCARARAGALHVPTTLLLAERDRIIRNRETRQWAERVCAGGLRLRELAGAEHTLEFEEPTAEFEAELDRWAAGGGD
ncbi:MAG: alpha/beta fold hydrolase [Planctomycetia bacterium]|nr:MAG: alpha/beta fold hydrolase [Planctomycetia bacterium]